jgi:heme-degrading monooxygenase HmoA
MIVVLFSITPRDDQQAVADEEEASARMWEIVSSMPGFISYKAYTAGDGETIAVVRFESKDALEAWKKHPEHRVQQQRARESSSTGSRRARRSASTGSPETPATATSHWTCSERALVRFP